MLHIVSIPPMLGVDIPQQFGDQFDTALRLAELACTRS